MRAQAKAELVIIAGLSGAGKTTFLRQLKADELPRQIISLLPKKIETWPVEGWKRGAFGAQNVRDDGLQRLVLHLTLNPLRKKAERKRLLELIREFHRVTVINILTPPDRIANQLIERSFGNDRLSRLTLNLLNPRRASIPRKLKLRILSLLVVRQKKFTEENRLRKIEGVLSRVNTYTNEAYDLAMVQNDLRDVLQMAAEAGIEIKQVCIEPGPHPRSEDNQIYQWRQLEG